MCLVRFVLRSKCLTTFGSLIKNFEWANRSATRHTRVDRANVQQTRTSHTDLRDTDVREREMLLQCLQGA